MTAKSHEPKPAPKRCARPTRAGGTCKQAAGFGTDHVGTGACKFHGGSSPTGRAAARREAALEFARGALGAAVAGSALDALQESVELSRGLVAYYRHELAGAALEAAQEGEQGVKARARMEDLREPYREAIKLERETAQAAITSKVAERRQLLAERQAALLAAAIADGLQEAFGDLATSERRTVFARVVRSRLLVLEAQDEPAPPALAA